MFYSLLLAKCLVYGGCVSMEMTTLWLFLVCATRASQHSCEADHVSSDGVGTHADYTAQDYLDSNTSLRVVRWVKRTSGSPGAHSAMLFHL